MTLFLLFCLLAMANFGGMDACLSVVNLHKSLFFSPLDHYALCQSCHSNTERSCLQSFVRLGHHDRWIAWPQDAIRRVS